MTSPEEAGLAPALTSAFYRSLANLAVEAGHTIGGTLAVSGYTAPLDLLPDVVRGRFPSDLADCTPFFTVRALNSEIAGRKPPLMSEVSFHRAAPPDDPAGRGFRQNAWMVNYTARGNDPGSIHVAVSVRAKRMFVRPPEPPLADPAAAHTRSVEEFIAKDADVAARTQDTHLPIDGTIARQPPVLAPELGELIDFSRFLLDFSRTSRN